MKDVEFKSRVYKILKLVPRGKLTTYKAIAAILGKPKAARAVGRALRCNTQLVKIPCHRVICSDGRVGGYKGGVRRKIDLLKKEGIKIKLGRVINLQGFLFENFLNANN